VERGPAYHPLACELETARAVDAAVIELRDAVAAAARSCSVRLGHRQLGLLRTALSDMYRNRAGGGWPTMLELDAVLDDGLAAAMGDLTSSEIFREGPPLGWAVERAMVFGLGGIPNGQHQVWSDDQTERAVAGPGWRRGAESCPVGGHGSGVPSGQSLICWMSPRSAWGKP